MGNNGKPTVIDLEKEFVVVVICPETFFSTQFTSIKLVEEKSKVNIEYKIIKKEKQNYSIVPFNLMIVDKEHIEKHFVLKQY
jgi:riboflavin synthase alpha subunit